jgi:hypothetical protein
VFQGSRAGMDIKGSTDKHLNLLARCALDATFPSPPALAGVIT